MAFLNFCGSPEQDMMSDNDSSSDGGSAADFEYGDSQEVSTYEIIERAVHRAGFVFPAFTHSKIPRSRERQSNEMDFKLPLKFAQRNCRASWNWKLRLAQRRLPPRSAFLFHSACHPPSFPVFLSLVPFCFIYVGVRVLFNFPITLRPTRPHDLSPIFFSP
jgi:hypothetical protein